MTSTGQREKQDKPGLVDLVRFLFEKTDVTMATGMIHNALVSLTVVAILSASSPKRQRWLRQRRRHHGWQSLPMFELVLRQVECVAQYGENKKSDGIQGMKTVPMETEISVSFALTMGATAAMRRTSATYGGSG